MNTSIKNIVIFGGGLAGHVTALALSERLPKNINVKLILTPDADSKDLFFGNVTAPSTYDFLLSLNITEPELLLHTNSSFSLGTRFKNWGKSQCSWTQTFHRPLPVHHGVKFHHYVNRSHEHDTKWSLNPYIMSVHAADKGVFAHPPEGKSIPLTTVEYGYHFTPTMLTKLLSSKLSTSRAIKTVGKIASFDKQGDTTKALVLSNGQIVNGDFFIDCTSQKTPEYWQGKRVVQGVHFEKPNDTLISVVRTLTETNFGWHATTPLQGSEHTLCIFDEKDKSIFESAYPKTSPSQSITIGRIESPWQSNVLKIGQNASALDPLTPAPLTSLQGDVKRLIELIPTTANMTVEAREYNCRFAQDFDHAAMFHRALFDGNIGDGPSYQKAANDEPIPDKLKSKRVQFESRGVYVGYDLEPFNEQDWVLMYLGLGCIPQRHDPLADRVEQEQIAAMLNNISKANTQMCEKIPPHQTYLTKLLKFLREKHV